MSEQCGLGLKVWPEAVGSDDSVIQYPQSMPTGDHPECDHGEKLCHVSSLLRDAQLLGDKVGGFALNRQFQVALNAPLGEGCCDFIDLVGDR